MIHRQKPFRCQALPVLILTNSEFPEMDVMHLGSIRPDSREQQKPNLSCRSIVLFQSFSQFIYANSQSFLFLEREVERHSYLELWQRGNFFRDFFFKILFRVLSTGAVHKIVPSRTTHSRICCGVNFCGYSAGEMASEIPESFDIFGPQLNTFRSVGILLKYFRRKLLQFEWSKTVSNWFMSRFISLTKLCCAASFTRAPQNSTLSFTFIKD